MAQKTYVGATRESHMLLCDCGNSEHQVIFTYWTDSEPDDDFLYVSFHLHSHENIFQRLKAAIKYVFGHHSRFGHWDEILVSQGETEKLRGFMEDFLG